MVGVPGRSKACHTCLKRRVKCDESRPTCLRCAKAGYKCAGYERPLEFRNHKFTTNEKTPRMVTENPKEKKAKTRVAATELVLRLNNGSCNHVPSELSLVAFKGDIQFAYLFDNFVWSSYGTPWLQYSARGMMGGLSLAASQAFSQSVFGRHHRRSDIETEGQIHYGSTVRDLSTELSRVGHQGSETLIVPIMILLMHASTIPDPQAAFFHAKGLMKVMQICGPEKFKQLPLRLAFESCRATLFTIALIGKQRSFLELPEWRLVPWSSPDAFKTPQNELVDILVTVPGFLDDVKRLADGVSDFSPQDLVKRLQQKLDELYRWRWAWEGRTHDAVWEVESDKIPHGKARLSDFRVLRKVLCFETFSAAIEICLYNAVLLCLLGLLWQFEPPTETTTTRLSRTPLALPGDFNTLYEPAQEICRVFEFQLLNVSHCRESALFWLFPLGLASKVLEDEPLWQKWIKGMLDTSKVTRGYGTGNSQYAYVSAPSVSVRLPVGHESGWLYRTGMAAAIASRSARAMEKHLQHVSRHQCPFLKSFNELLTT